MQYCMLHLMENKFKYHTLLNVLYMCVLRIVSI